MEEAEVLEAAAAAGVEAPRSAGRAAGSSPAGEVWRLRAADGDWALRVYTPGREFAVLQEAAVLAAAREKGLPVPGVRASGTFQGHPYLLSEWCSGVTFVEALWRQPDTDAELGRSFGRAHAGVHRIEVPAGFRQPGADGDRLLHLDFHPLNLLTDGARVTAILDWENACAGDPRRDVARTVSIIQIHAPALAGGVLRRTAIRAFLHGYLEGYRDEAPLTLRDMAPFYAWAGAFAVRDLAPKADAATMRRARRWERFWRRITEA